MAGKRLTGKFSEEEYTLIKQIQEKEKINNNQLVRNSVNLLIQMALVQDFFKDTSFVKLMKPMAKDMNEYISSQDFVEKIDKFAQRMKRKEIVEIEKKAKELEEKSKTLTKKRKVGRPKKKKVSKKRGRPKGS